MTESTQHALLSSGYVIEKWKVEKCELNLLKKYMCRIVTNNFCAVLSVSVGTPLTSLFSIQTSSWDDVRTLCSVTIVLSSVLTLRLNMHRKVRSMLSLHNTFIFIYYKFITNFSPMQKNRTFSSFGYRVITN